MKIKRDGYTIELSQPTLYVDNESRGRSGHMTHAIVEYAPGKLIDFNSNCSAVIHGGHSTYGFVEYRLSNDGGENFSEIYELPYSKKSFFDGVQADSIITDINKKANIIFFIFISFPSILYMTDNTIFFIAYQ